MNADALILCGGYGSRLKSVTEGQKTMVDVNGNPFMEILINNIRKQGIRRIILCAGYWAHQLLAYYAPDDDIIMSIEEEKLGTGGAIKKAERLIGTRTFFVFNGDTISDVNLKHMYDSINRHNFTPDICVAKDENGVPAGVYTFRKTVFDRMPDRPFSLEDWLADRSKVNWYEFEQPVKFTDIGTPERLAKFKESLE